MQTTFKFEQVVRFSPQEKPVKYVLPIKPSEKYKQLENSFGKDKNKPFNINILKQTQRIPFPDIRQLIITYKIRDISQEVKQELYDRNSYNYSDILQEKYQMNLALKKEDQLLCQDMKRLEIQDHKLVLLMGCCQNYLKLLDKINRAKDNEYRNKMNSLFADSIDHSQGLGKTQEQRAQQLLAYYQGIRQRFSDTNTNVLNIQNDYFEFVSYSRNLQNAMLAIGRTQNVTATKPQNFTEIRSIQQFTNQVRQNHRKIRNFLQQLIQCLFTWRYKVKTNNIQQGDYHSMIKTHGTALDVNNQIHITYLKVMGVTNVLEVDRGKAQNIYQSVSSEYRNFLTEYIKVKEVYIFQGRLKEYLEVIQSQKNILAAHLKKNYGMVVPYKKSQLYSKHIGNIETSDKRHLKRMVDKQIEPLQFAFKFINQDYERLYKSACDNRDIRNEVNKINSQLENYGNQNPKDMSYVVHLQQSCRRLMKMAK